MDTALVSRKTQHETAGPSTAAAAGAISSASPVDALTFSHGRIRQVAREHGPAGNVISQYLKQGWLETRLRWRGRGFFRSNDNQRAVQGYAALQPADFQTINAIQRWANWRTIPRNLSGRITSQPLMALDLCSGTGDSTRVLACYLPAGSRILGMEIDPRFVDQARRGSYVSFDHQPQDVRFVVQDVLAPFRDSHGQLIDDRSVDLINVSGAVAVHFDKQSTQALAAQCARVMQPGGLALVDSGYEGASPRVVRNSFEQQGFVMEHKARSCFVDMSWQLCLRYRG